MNLGPEARALLELAGGEDDPSEADAARVRGKIAARIAMTAAAGAAASLVSKSAAASTTSVAPAALGAATAGAGVTGTVSGAGAAAGSGAIAGGASVAAKLLLAAALASGTSAVIVSSRPPLVLPSTAPSANTQVPPPRSVPSAPSVPAATPSASVVPRPADDDRQALPDAVVPPVAPAVLPLRALKGNSPHGGASARTAGASDPSDAVADEAAILHAAHAALARGDGTAALAHLDEHAERFPHGALREEQTAARVLALCATGRVHEARALGLSFMATSPRSPLISQIKHSCASRH